MLGAAVILPVFSPPALDVIVFDDEGCVAQSAVLRSAVEQVCAAVYDHLYLLFAECPSRQRHGISPPIAQGKDSAACPATRKEYFRRLTNARVQLPLSPPRSFLAGPVSQIPLVPH